MPARGRRPHGVVGWRTRLLVVLGMVAFVGAVYVLVVLGAGAVLGDLSDPHPLLSIAATTVVALTFEPVRSRLERQAARLTREAAASPYEVLSGFSDAVGGLAPAEDVAARMARTLVHGTDAAWAEVWLDVRGRMVLAGAWPPPADGEQRGQNGDPTVRRHEIRYAGEVLGELRLPPRDDRHVTPVEERLVAGLVGQAGLVLRGVRLRAALAQRFTELSARADELRASRRRLVAAQDAERRKLERDLHDGAQQHLLALGVNLRLAQSVAHRSPERAAQILEGQVEAARTTLKAVEDLSRGIYPTTLTDRGLPEAVAEAAASSGIRVRLDVDAVGRHPTDVEAALYFTCLEALQNAAKHSGAREVRVRLARDAGVLALTVEDDGRGFDAARTQPGSGSANMGDRMAAVGGVLRIDTSPGRGVRVRGHVPLGDGGAPR